MRTTPYCALCFYLLYVAIIGNDVCCLPLLLCHIERREYRFVVAFREWNASNRVVVECYKVHTMLLANESYLVDIHYIRSVTAS